MYSVYGCPTHYGVSDEGLCGSIDYLNARFHLDIPVLPEITADTPYPDNLKHLDSVIATCEAIAARQDAILSAGTVPLMVAGDHSAFIGSIAGTAAHYDHPGLIWVDAHPDINTDATTVTGNIHGMPVAASLGMGTSLLTRIFRDAPKLVPERIVMLGLRDIDPPEQVFLDDLHIRYYTYDDICRISLDRCIQETIDYLSGLDAVHMSFDIDSMDPALMPGVSVPVPGGFTPAEADQLLDHFLTRLPLVSVDVVEFNTVHDREDVTARYVVHAIRKILESAQV